MAVDDIYTKLLLHMDGDDSGVNFIDESGKLLTVRGNACTKITQKKFGVSSGYFVCYPQARLAFFQHYSLFSAGSSIEIFEPHTVKTLGTKP